MNLDLENQLKEFVQADRKKRGRINAILALIVVVVIGQFVITSILISDHHKILDKVLVENENVIADQKYVLDKQAVPAIIYLSNQIQRLKGIPVQVLLGSEHKPFDQQLKGQGR